MTTKVISFDGDNTLWDFAAAQRAALRRVLETMVELGAPRGIVDVDRMLAIRQETGEELGEDETPLLALRRESLRRAAIEAQLEATEQITDRLFKTFLEERDRSIRAFDDASDVLGRLCADGWTIALLTNGNADPSGTGLAEFLSALFYAENIGARKPDIAAFQAVAEATQSRLQDLVHVGDSLDHDVAGANGAGATSVWLNRNDEPASTEITPNIEIGSLSELPGVLNRLK